MAIFNDTFTEASNTLLQSHAPNTGTSWSKLYTDNAGLDFYVDAALDVLRSENNTSDQGVFYTANTTYTSPDYYIQVTFTDDGDASWLKWYWLLRVQDVDNLYAFVITTGANASKFYKKVSGTWTAIGSGKTMNSDFVNGDVLKFEVIGSTLKFYIDGVLALTTTDTAISAAGKAGAATGGGPETLNSTDDCSTYWQWDNFSITAAAGTNTQINVSDSWKSVSAVSLNIGDVWKTVTKIQINISDTWRTIFG